MNFPISFTAVKDIYLLPFKIYPRKPVCTALIPFRVYNNLFIVICKIAVNRIVFTGNFYRAVRNPTGITVIKKQLRRQISVLINVICFIGIINIFCLCSRRQPAVCLR